MSGNLEDRLRPGVAQQAMRLESEVQFAYQQRLSDLASQLGLGHVQWHSGVKSNNQLASAKVS